jgi:deoxyribodipyrimidine photolyase-related protein
MVLETQIRTKKQKLKLKSKLKSKLKLKSKELRKTHKSKKVSGGIQSKNDTETIWIHLPVHLFDRKTHSLPVNPDTELYVEDPWFFTYLPFNRIKLGFLMISGRRFCKEQLSIPESHCFYLHSSHSSSSRNNPMKECIDFLKVHNDHIGSKKLEVHMYDPIDEPCRSGWKSHLQKAGFELIIHTSPSFLESMEDLESYKKMNNTTNSKMNSKNSKKDPAYNHSKFYEWQRKRLGLLYDKSKDKWTGGKLSFDKENRDPFPKTLNKEPMKRNDSKLTKEEVELLKVIEKEYADNPGPLDIKSLQEGIETYPLTSQMTKVRFHHFIHSILPNFGPYEDAIHPDIRYGYHSVLSSSLNCGLITPGEIQKELQSLSNDFVMKHIASLEGFIRQVFGWRSYVRMMYYFERDRLLKGNALGHTYRLGKRWFKIPEANAVSGSSPLTKMDWLDDVIRNCHNLGYAHHIERLMILSNYFLLLQVHPRDVLEWFWTIISIDAYEWVMVPNVMGMGQYADDGLMMTRPYISSSAYLQKMSRGTLKSKEMILKGNKEGVSWEDIWKGLYYGFLKRHKNEFKNQYAMAPSIRYMMKTSPKELHLQDGDEYRKEILY